MLVLGSAQLHGQSAIFVNGQAGYSVGVSVGATAVLDVVGPASQPFALGIGFQASSIPTPFGPLGFDPFDPQSFIFLDGFDSDHPNHLISFLSVTGTFTLFATPYQTGPAGQTFYTQALVLEPGSIEGAALTDPIAVSAVSPPPVVTSATPNYSSPGGNLFINGANFDPSGAGNIVKVGDVVCPVLNSGQDWLFVHLPANVRSGAVSVTTASGTGGGDGNNVHTWCAVASNPITEGTQPAVINETTTILGLIAAVGEKDTFTMQANAGEEIYAEVYSWDPNTQSITGTINSANFFFDVSLRILRNSVPVARDDDSGPHLNAGIGLYGGRTQFIADQSGQYEIEVDTYLSLGTGWYMLIMGTRAPTQADLHVVSLHPNVARPGDTVQCYVSGVLGGSPSEYTLDVGGVTIPVDGIIPGRIDFTMPHTQVNSGPVNLIGPTEATNHIINDMHAWLAVINPDLQHEQSLSGPLQAGDTVYGQVTSLLNAPPFYQPGSTAAIDTFAFSATAGIAYTIEVTAFDDATGRAVSGAFLVPGFLDPEIRVLDGILPLTTDGSGGPGLNALIGGSSTAPWVAPQSKTYYIEVSSLFSITQGSYLLNIRQAMP